MPAFNLYDSDDTAGYMNPALMDEAEKLARRHSHGDPQRSRVQAGTLCAPRSSSH